MTPRTVALAAATLTLGLFLPATGDAACNPTDRSACTTAPRALGSPLQLRRFIGRRPHKASAKRRATQRAPRKIAARIARTVPLPPRRPEVSAASASRLIPTIDIKARALTVTETNLSAGFGAPTEPWQARSAFAPTEEPELPLGIRIVAADEFNEIDRAAALLPEARNEKPDGGASVSLVTPANAAEPRRTARSEPTDAARSWPQRFYDKAVDRLLAAAFAVRALFN